MIARALLAFLLASAGETDAPTGSSVDTYWGPLPAPTENNTTRFEAQGQPAWETAVNLPWNIVMLPVKGLALGVEHTAEFVDENDTMQRLIHLFPLHVGGAQITPGISVASQDGFGGSLAIDVPEFLGPKQPLKLRLSGKTEGSRKATLGVRIRRHDQSVVEIGAGHRGNPNARYFGLGPDSDPDRESYYQHEVSWAGVSWRRGLGAGMAAELRTVYSGVAATSANVDDDPLLTEEFAGEVPFGYRNLSLGYSVGLELAHDNVEIFGIGAFRTTDRLRPERGGLRRARVSWFEGRGNSKSEFWTWRAEAQQFLPLRFTRRALAVRALATQIRDEGDEPVPFQRQITNDDPDLLRGYQDGRFRGLGLASITAEYRWPAWSLNSIDGVGADAYVFVDYGQVFDEIDEIQVDTMTTSYGGGLRIGGYGRYVGRVEIGVSESGDWQFRLRADQIFQYAGLGLFEGRSPVPAR